MSRDKPYRLEITLGEELLAKLDKQRGHEPRASFVKRVLGERVGNQHFDPGPSMPVVENLGETSQGMIVVTDPSKPVRYEQKYTARTTPGEGTPVDLSEKIKELEPAEGVGNPVGSNIVGRRTGATNVRATGEGTPLPKIAPRRAPR